MTLLTATRDEMSFCPGCSHGAVLELIAAAVARMGVAPRDVCMVSDIGCIGMSDRYFACHTFHGLHGRSVTYAEGLKRVRPELLVIVLIGDGGCGIGTGHLVHAARRGADVKVIVCNNFNFGMTGGQHSPTTPPGGRTPTTPGGAWEAPFDVCGTVAANGASYVSRCSAYDADCGERIEAALRAPGFALIDVWELCVAYYVGSNRLTPPRLRELSEATGLRFGVLHRAEGRRAGGEASGEAPAADEARGGVSPFAGGVLDWSPARVGLRMAGSAGQRIRSAVGVLGEIVVAGGLYAAQYDDFPISVRKGHSVSDLVVSREPIRYAGVDEPDLVIVMSADGQRRAGEVGACRQVWLEASLPGAPQARRFNVRELERRAGRGGAALAVLAGAVVSAGWVGDEALLAAARGALAGKFAAANVAAIAAGIGLADRRARAAAGGASTACGASHDPGIGGGQVPESAE